MTGARRLRTRLASLAAAGLLIGACGGGGGGDNGKAAENASADGSTTTSPATAQAGGDPTTGSPGAPGGPTVTTGAPGSAPATGSTPGNPPDGGETPKPPLPMEVELEKDCVKPGGTQTVTVRTEPESPVGYSAEYADGKTAMDAGYYGGVDAGKTDGKGVYKATWTIAPNAPPGEVKVRVFATHPAYTFSERVATFELSTLTGKCS